MVDQINPLKKKKTKFVIETGINDFVIADNNFTNAEVSPGRSWFWNYSLMKQISKSKSMVIEIGISYLTNRFSIENEVALTRNGNDNLPYQFQKFNNASKNPCLSVSYLQIPLNFKFNLGKSFYANIGVFGGYRVGSTQQLEYSIGTEEVKEERKDSYDLNKWNYGGRLGIGIKSWDLFFNYNLSNLFRSEEIYKYNIYSIGTSFRI
jgi:long-subunit fatty acid transport protein